MTVEHRATAIEMSSKIGEPDFAMRVVCSCGWKSVGVKSDGAVAYAWSIHIMAQGRTCPSCRHREHRGLCTARSGGTAYACGCSHQAAIPIPIADPTRAVEVVEVPQCEGDHFFENRCATCGGSQPDGPCEVCPHIGPQQVCSAEHFARRPCRHCGSSNLRTVRVRAPRTP